MLELLTPFILFYCHFPINNNNNNNNDNNNNNYNNSFQPQCQLSLRIPDHTTQPLITLLRKEAGQTFLPQPLTRKGTSSKPLPLKGHTGNWQSAGTSSSPTFLALGIPSGLIKLTSSTQRSTPTTQTTRLPSIMLINTGSTLKLNRGH
jgi:hypothetical protein